MITKFESYESDEDDLDNETSYTESFKLNYDSVKKHYLVLKFNVPLDLVNYFGGLYSETNKYNL